MQIIEAQESVLELPFRKALSKTRWRELNYRGTRRFVELSEDDESEEDGQQQEVASFEDDFDDEVLFGSHESIESIRPRRPLALLNESLNSYHESENSIQRSDSSKQIDLNQKQ